jgi:transposase InsO family protein
MEREWELDRMQLYQVRRAHPDWTLAQIARVVAHSLSWVKKWLRRFREAGQPSLEMFKSQSRAPHHRPFQVTPAVRDAILSLRDELKNRYGRVVGAKTILYHLHQDAVLPTQSVYLPRAPRTIWRILKAAGRIPTRVREHHPVERPDAMTHWEMDFGQQGDTFEFLTVVDRGTSILVDTQTQPHYNAETALLAVAQLLILIGMPRKLRFDNDPRFVGNWMSDGYPSPLMRFLLCLGVEPDVVEPGRPQDKPFAERSVRTLKHECLWREPPENWLDAAGILRVYREFYNRDRAHQSPVCGNRPPYTAFPNLPTLPPVPEQVDPDAWLKFFHRRVFRRRVGQNGKIAVGRHEYYVGYTHAGSRVGVLLDAEHKVFHVLQGATILVEKEIQALVGHVLPFQAYLRHMLVEAQATNNN